MTSSFSLLVHESLKQHTFPLWILVPDEIFQIVRLEKMSWMEMCVALWYYKGITSCLSICDYYILHGTLFAKNQLLFSVPSSSPACTTTFCLFKFSFLSQGHIFRSKWENDITHSIVNIPQSACTSWQYCSHITMSCATSSFHFGIYVHVKYFVDKHGFHILHFLL